MQDWMKEKRKLKETKENICVEFEKLKTSKPVRIEDASVKCLRVELPKSDEKVV